MKFIDDYTFTEQKQWDNEKLMLVCDVGDLKFREALEFEIGRKERDSLRENAFNFLYVEFKENCEFLENRATKNKFFFSKTYSKELKTEVEENYNFAIAGELSRVGAP